MDGACKPGHRRRGVIAVPDGGMDIPLYIQGDYKTTVCYLGGEAKSAASSGCGAACSSMVISYLTGNTSQNPHTLFKWAYDNGYYHGSGLSHSAVSAMLNLYGVSGEWIGKDEAAIVAALTEGKPIIAHMGPGVFTKGGHYILLRGITEDGHVLINDPGSKKRNGYAYPLSLILAQSKSATPFMVCGK